MKKLYNIRDFVNKAFNSSSYVVSNFKNEIIKNFSKFGSYCHYIKRNNEYVLFCMGPFNIIVYSEFEKMFKITLTFGYRKIDLFYDKEIGKINNEEIFKQLKKLIND